MIKNNPYKFTVLALYINYVLQGMAAIILSQNMMSLVSQMNTTIPQFSLVISAIGLGRILSLYSAGRLSDKYGRKLVVVIGMICYFFFFGGILVSQNVYLAIFFALFAGVSNAMLDTGTYPALLEAMPELFDSMSVLNRAFISVGQFILPIIVSFSIANELHHGISFLFCLVILVINMIAIKFLPFPQINSERIENKKEVTKIEIPQFRKYVAGTCLILFGFTSVATFNIFVTWIPHVAQNIVGMEATTSVKLVSLYSLFSFISVLTTSVIVKKWIKPIYLVLGYTLLSCISLLVLAIYPSVETTYLAVFGIGFFATGGIWQLGLTTLLDLFSTNKGRVTSYYSFLTSVALMVMPYITGQLALENIMFFNSMVTLTGIILALITLISIEKPIKK